MVLKRRLDYGLNGYEFPFIPRAARSVRRMVPFKKQFQENQMSAFDLLADVAGKLLLENDNTSPSGNVMPNDESAVNKECGIEDEPLEAKACDRGSPERNFIVSELIHQVVEESHCHEGSLYSNSGVNLGLASASTNSGCKENGGMSVNGEVAEHSLKDEPCKSEKVVDDIGAGMFTSDVPMVSDDKLHELDSIDSTLCAHHIPHCSFPATEDNVNIVSRDDDENSSGCTHPVTKRFLRPTPRIGDRRIRKIMASRCWKVASRRKDTSFSNRRDLKTFYQNGKNYHRLDRSERLYPIKKRRRVSYTSPSNYGAGEFVSEYPQKGFNGDVSVAGSGKLSPGAMKRKSYQPRDRHVKLRIKSFKVPELFVEIPESATVGSLKRTVVDALTAFLGGGVRVDVLLQGRKVRDDHQTLSQTGISHSSHLDALGFSLEPNSSPDTGSLSSVEFPSTSSCPKPQPLSSYPRTPVVVHQSICAASPEPHAVNLRNPIESDHDSAPSPIDTLIAQNTSDSKRPFTVPSMDIDPLALVPANRKTKRAEMAQRRIRRPFSVAEVEALVQAVEELGTGRWRDVKMKAFDHAKHRTYVDLKASFLDKWKTLVHTATISPQQRRGEPVPQELLDRVLTAHAYWSHQLAFQLSEHPSSPLKALPLQSG
ncbi:Telomere repeat-binding protein 5 [Linum grandiflorum]